MTALTAHPHRIVAVAAASFILSLAALSHRHQPSPAPAPPKPAADTTPRHVVVLDDRDAVVLRKPVDGRPEMIKILFMGRYSTVVAARDLRTGELELYDAAQIERWEPDGDVELRLRAGGFETVSSGLPRSR